MTEYTVEFVGTGETISCSDKETILSRCLEEGITQEYSCRVGMCLACTAKIHEGEVEQTIVEKRGFTEEEAEEYALTCMARPNSDLKLERGVYPPSIENDAATEGAGSAFADD
ncbi:2Fe-2S iron-sulfur cluster-binding protein [Halosegnis rubeus]|jgi:ferredoxin|uniref:2Fe-2S iron-sulfur cluster binding domain-containing protein n=1 Tax=Halosegnis rubeus TaxID=2212850 RepID=A0A5N5UAA2_9EURY|nr:2Fe-2S iron-sulfur cluster-binding protein [Halosegnis rubeus]KAB7515555.1 2Fe-2S iron-sulfur cluster binding domain-containing protein [Halosegnis rubeus]KAB7518543.1 2Fe-2S iron-sulfur cluster binding domain-containing protein [Halosegnis rubeus]